MCVFMTDGTETYRSLTLTSVHTTAVQPSQGRIKKLKQQAFSLKLTNKRKRICMFVDYNWLDTTLISIMWTN